MSRTGTGWYPLRLTTPVKQHVFGGRYIPRYLGRDGMPEGRIAETWEVSDVEGDGAHIVNGALAGRSLRGLTEEFPEELVGRGWRGGPRFPLLTKFIDAYRPLPVHLHPDDEAARRLEGEPNGKTEAWHIVAAAPGATALVGVREGVGRDELRRALLAQDFDSVMRRLPVLAGRTIYVPAGTLHSFGPETLVYEIEQTSDLQQHAMRHRMEDGSPIPDDQWHSHIEALLDEWKPAPRPEFTPGLTLPSGEGTERRVLCAGPYFALERLRAHSHAGALVRAFDTAVVLSNVGTPTTVTCGPFSEPLGRASTLLLPAALGFVEIQAPADVLIGYVPDLNHDIRTPLLAAGHPAADVAALGEGLGGHSPTDQGT
ncbi:type I phosphomannose isomerase catalytic subunit [Streptomyces iconiensis]|uniref:Mannose-6-phosphate isomerase n=1 Tax=Streptomyces iconiensis TaxID=1384038 RepID=A0ABT7A3M9_9ACTN|nr:type I phosphomannose isomerase catalytic subunit [Streptomyces iconiensis]MDJ1135672.1 mannose-6-phosphate isomerase [Streptomyces iconiensis]